MTISGENLTASLTGDRHVYELMIEQRRRKRQGGFVAKQGERVIISHPTTRYIRYAQYDNWERWIPAYAGMTGDAGSRVTARDGVTRFFRYFVSSE